MKKFTKKESRGFTLVESMVVMTILLAVVGIVVNFMMLSWQGHNLTKVHAFLKTRSQMALYRLSASVNQARMIMGNDTLGNGYRAKMDLTDSPAPITDSILPTLRITGSIAEEKNCTDYPENYFRSNAIGNSFLYAQALDTFGDFSSTTSELIVDIFDFRYLYLTEESDNGLSIRFEGNSLPVLRLMEWRSQPVVDYASLRTLLLGVAADPGFTAGDLAAIKTDLRDAGYLYAWDRAASSATNAFRNIDTDDDTDLPAVSGGFTLPKSRVFNTLLLTSSTDMVYSVAYNQDNTSGSATYFPVRDEVPFFFKPIVSEDCPATAKEKIPAVNQPALSAGSKFPGGFEVMVVGPGSGRSVVMRLTTVGQGNRAFASHAHMVSIYARDL